MLQRRARQALQFHWENAVLVERVVFERVAGHLRLAQVRLLETVAVDNQNSVRFQIRDVYLQRRGIHGNQHVDRVARRVNLVG